MQASLSTFYCLGLSAHIAALYFILLILFIRTVNHGPLHLNLSWNSHFILQLSSLNFLFILRVRQIMNGLDLHSLSNLLLLLQLMQLLLDSTYLRFAFGFNHFLMDYLSLHLISRMLIYLFFLFFELSFLYPHQAD